MNRKILLACCLSTALFAGAPAFAAEPTLHEIYQAANGGHVEQAERMMREVLNAHPSSAKAHFVEAELLARQGKNTQAGDELTRAEQLSPGLPFASPAAVSSLRAALHRENSPAPAEPLAAQARPRNASTFPTLPVFGGLALAALAFWLFRRPSRRDRPSGQVPSANGWNGTPQPGTPYSPGNWGNAAPGASGGLGGQMLGGLATGAAVGAGVVAGEALMHRFFDKPAEAAGKPALAEGSGPIPDLPATPLYDMGGDDFGIADGNSWDDDSTNNDWN